jgi:ComEC/Rec2-related protein
MNNRHFYCRRAWCNFGSSFYTTSEQLSLSRSFESTAAALRSMLVAAHQRVLGQRDGSLLASMVLGDKAVSLDKSLVTMFRNVGLSHVLAASGFNLTVVMVMTFFVGRLIIPSSAAVHSLCFATMCGYVFVAGASQSVMRAAIMCTVLLVIKLTKLRAQLLATLASALLITLIADPGALTDVGLQLSYAATAGLILCARPLSELICAGRKEKIIRWFAETVAVVFASQLAVLPIQLVYFWQLGLMFLPANLVITPILAPLTILGFVSSVLALFFPLHGFVESTFSLLVWMVDMLALLPLELMLRWVDFLASFDGAIFRVGQPRPEAVVLYVLSWLCAVAALHTKRYRRAVLLGFVIALIYLFWRPAFARPSVVCWPNRLMIINTDRHAILFSHERRKNLSPSSKSELSSVKPSAPKVVQSFANFRGLTIDESVQLNALASKCIRCGAIDFLIYGEQSNPSVSEESGVATCLESRVQRGGMVGTASRTIVVYPIFASRKQTKRLSELPSRVNQIRILCRRAKSNYVLLVGDQQQIWSIQTQLESANALTRLPSVPGVSVITEGNAEAILVGLDN